MAHKADPELRAAFLMFLETLIEGRCTTELWHTYAVAHYHDPKLESARIRVVRAAIGMGDEHGEPPVRPMSETVRIVHALLSESGETGP